MLKSFVADDFIPGAVRIRFDLACSEIVHWAFLFLRASIWSKTVNGFFDVKVCPSVASSVAQMISGS